MSKIERFRYFIERNFTRVLDEESKESLGDRSTYIGASDIGGCPYQTVMSKRHPQKHSLKQNIIFQRGHLAEEMVSKMLNGLNVEDQHEALGQLDQIQLKAHIDKLIHSRDRCVVVEVKTVSAPVDEPYESWVLQVQFQMGLLLQDGCNNEVEAYVLAIDVNSGWLGLFHFELDDDLFELCLSKAQHIEDAMKGLVEPKAIIQGYCSTCHFKMECLKQGRHALELPAEVKEDLKFIKESNLMAKEAKIRSNRVKNYMTEMNIEAGKSESAQTVVTVRKQTSKRVDFDIFKERYPDIYKELTKESTYYRMSVL